MASAASINLSPFSTRLLCNRSPSPSHTFQLRTTLTIRAADYSKFSVADKSSSPSNGTRGKGRFSQTFKDENFNRVSKAVVGLDPSLAVKNKAAEVSSELKGTSIFLVGINSNMKTMLGNVLADALRYYYFDSESLVEQAAGGESAAILRERDEKGFLDSETEVLKQLSSMGRLVVCTGDGAVQSSTNLALMRHGISIWIDIPIPIIAREVIESSSQGPPADAISSDYSEVLAKLNAGYDKMKERYAIADATVSLQKVALQLGYDTMDAVSIEDVALEVFVEIEKLTRVKKMMEDAARPF